MTKNIGIDLKLSILCINSTFLCGLNGNIFGNERNLKLSILYNSSNHAVYSATAELYKDYLLIWLNLLFVLMKT